MGGHILDHLVLSERRRFHEMTKSVVFGSCLAIIFGVFWWFHKVTYGIEGPVAETWGLGWRKVSIFSPSTVLFDVLPTSVNMYLELEYLLKRIDHC